MKSKRNVFYSLFIILAGVSHFPTEAQQKNNDAASVYLLDVKKSRLLWKTSKNSHNGYILFNSGSLTHFTNGWPTRGTFSINMNSMRSTDKTSVAKRKKVEGELRNDYFFAVAKYPAASMVVDNITPKPDGATYNVYGKLTIKGITRPVEFTTIMKLNGNTVTATANTSINRSHWNINHQPEPGWDVFSRMKDKLIDDEIPINLELLFTKKQ